MIYHEGRSLLKFDCRDVRVLDDMFWNAPSPIPRDFLAESPRIVEWSVTMLTGPVPDMGGRFLRHRKSFNQSEIYVEGCNILRRGWRWGFFRLVEKWDVHGRRMLVIDYDVEANGGLVRSFRDDIRATSDPDVMLGRFSLRIEPDRFHFLSYFALTMIKLSGEE